MIAKVLTEVILRLLMLLPRLVASGWKKFSEYQAVKKEKQKHQETVKKVEDAKTHDEVRTAADDLP